MTYKIHIDIHNTQWHTQYTMTYTIHDDIQYTMTYTIHDDIHNTRWHTQLILDIHNTQWYTQYIMTYTIHDDIQNTQWHTQYTMTYTTHNDIHNLFLTFKIHNDMHHDTVVAENIHFLILMPGMWSFKCAHMCLYVYASVDYALCIWVTIIICGITYSYGNRKNHIHIRRQMDF